MSFVDPPKRTGSSLLLGSGYEFWREPIRLMTDLARDYPDLVRVRLGFDNVYLVNSPVIARHILQTNGRNYGPMKYVTDSIRSISGENLFTSQGARWQRFRKLLQPTFNRGVIGRFGELMTEEADRLVAAWRPREGERVSVAKAMRETTFNIASRVLCDTDLRDEEALRDAYACGADYITYRIQNPLAPPLFVPTPGNLAIKRQIGLVEANVRATVTARRKSGERHDDMLQAFVDSRYEDTGEPMTDDELVQQILMFYFGGNGPPAKVLTWAFHFMAKHPHVEQKLHAELDAVLGDRRPTMQDLPRLRYAKMLVDEILRLYPTAWATPRTAIEADTIGPYRIAAGSNFFVLLYTVHRHPAYWDSPEEFDPERFDPDVPDQGRQEAYLPFGAGQRSCIAGHFSMMEMVLVLASIARHVRLEADPGAVVEPQIGFPLGPRGDVPMTVRIRANR